MSNDEDDIGECLLDELFVEDIDLNASSIHQDILLDGDDEIKMFFGPYEQSWSKIEGRDEIRHPKEDVPSGDRLDSVPENDLECVASMRPSHRKAGAQLSSEFAEKALNNKSGTSVLSKIKQTNKEFLNSVINFVGSTAFRNDPCGLDARRRVPTKYTQPTNILTNFHPRREMRKTSGIEKRPMIQKYSLNHLSLSGNDREKASPNQKVLEQKSGHDDPENIQNRLEPLLFETNRIISTKESLKGSKEKPSPSCHFAENEYPPFSLPSSETNAAYVNLGSNQTKPPLDRFKHDHGNESQLGELIGLPSPSGTSKKTTTFSDDPNLARELGSPPLGSNIPISFSTGSGKRVSIDEKSLDRARQIMGGSPLGRSPPESSIPISFSTGSGKQVSIDEKSLDRARQIMGGSPLGSNIPISFSTGSGKQVSIDEKSLDRARQIMGGSPLGRSPLGRPSISFSTGSGKQVSIDEKSLDRARQIMGGSPLGRSPPESSIPISFSTGSGKRVSIDEKSLDRARQIMGGSPLGRSPLGRPSISFSTGSGKQVSIDEKSLDRARQIMGGSPLGRSPPESSIPISFSTGSGKQVSIDEKSLDIARKLVDFPNQANVDKTTASNIKIQTLSDGVNFGGGQDGLEEGEGARLLNSLGRSRHEKAKDRKAPRLTRQELVVPEFFKGYQSASYSQARLISAKVLAPTSILLDCTLETMRRYTFVLVDAGAAKGSELRHIEVDFGMVGHEVDEFLRRFPIFPGNMMQYRRRWFETQYMLVLYDECLKWSRRIKTKAKAVCRSVDELGCGESRLISPSIAEMKYPSIQKILCRICKRAIIEFFDAKRSPLIKICEGDFTVSAPLNLRILSYLDKTTGDDSNGTSTCRVMLCTDGWYVVRIFTSFALVKPEVKVMPRNIFVCGGGWLGSGVEHGHPLEIEASTHDFPQMVYGVNLIRPIRALSGFRLGFHPKPLLFRISRLVNTLEAPACGKEPSGSIDRGGGVSFLVQVMVIHTFPICYKEIVEAEEERTRVCITRDQSEMDISMNNEIYEAHQGFLQQHKSESEDSPAESAKRRRISLESKLLVLDHWKFMRLRESTQQKVEISDLINNSSILTLPSGVDLDEIVSIKPGTVIRLSWMKVIKSNAARGTGCSLSRLIPSPKTSLSAKKRVRDDATLNKVLQLVKRPVLTFENDPENLLICKGGWPISILGVLLQVYPIEERKRGFEHCFEFKVLLLTSTGGKVFVRVHTTGSHDSELRMCQRASNKLNKAFSGSGEPEYKDFVVLIENTEFHTFERATNLYHFNAKVPYALFTMPYSSGERHFSSSTTRRMLSAVIKDLRFRTKCNIPTLFDKYTPEEDSLRLPICTSCENRLSECSCIADELVML